MESIGIASREKPKIYLTQNEWEICTASIFLPDCYRIKAHLSFKSHQPFLNVSKNATSHKFTGYLQM